MTVSGSQIRRTEKRLGALEETVELLSDRKLLQAIKRSLDEIKQGKFTDYRDISELRADLDAEK